MLTKLSLIPLKLSQHLTCLLTRSVNDHKTVRSSYLFCSFSSAQTQWTHLLRILGQLVDKNNELENLN